MSEQQPNLPEIQQKSSSAENSLNDLEGTTEGAPGGAMLLTTESQQKKWTRNLIENEVLNESFAKNESDKRSIADLQSIFSEEQEIIEKMVDLSNTADSIERFKDLFEALYYEFSIRKSDKLKILDKISQKEEQTQEDLRLLEESLSKLQNELQTLKAYQNNKVLRHSGAFKMKSDDSFKFSEMYDWVIDIDLLTSITKEGWQVRFNKNFKKILSHSGEKEINSYDRWDGAIVAVVGLYDKGKTFVLNNLTRSNLPSGKKVNTKGLSFKHVDMEQGTKLILLDTAGSYSPVKIVSELSVIEKEATELFILDIVFELSDYFICVVNDFTSLDQRYLDKLSRNLQNSSTKSFREIIVVHNLKEVESGEILEHLWQTQVTQIYGSGNIQRTKVAAINPINNCLQEKHVVWFKTAYSRHVCLANDDSVLGATINPWTFSLLKYWLKAVIVPVNRDFSVVDSVLSISNHKLSSYFKTPITLGIKDTDQAEVKLIKAMNSIEKMRIPQVSIDSSGYVTTSPDSFLPKVDIIRDEKYCIFLEVPGMRKEDLTIYRQNIMTIVKGCKNKPYDGKDLIIEKNERKYGDFTMTFKIPENYERRWSSYEVKNGVLEVVYDKDVDENEKTAKGQSDELNTN